MTQRIATQILLTLLVSTLVTGCLEKVNDEPDSGQNNNTVVPPDSAVDAEPTADAAVLCQADDLVPQLTCGSGQKCTLVDAQNHVGCATTGFVTAYSACNETRPDDCSLSNLCSDADNPGVFTCLPFCDQLGAACLNGKCTHSISLAGGQTAYLCAPADSCDPVDDTGCGLNEHCYLDRTGGGLTFCVGTAGSQPAGSACADDYACLPGLTCFGPIGNGTCYPLCHAGNNGECSGVLCTDIPNTDYGLCI